MTAAPWASPAAFAELARRAYWAVYHHARRLLRRYRDGGRALDQDAEDVTQDVLLAAWRRRRALGCRGLPLRWLLRAASRRVWWLLRSSFGRPCDPSAWPRLPGGLPGRRDGDPAAEAARREAVGTVRLAAAALPGGAARVALDLYLAGHGGADIARRLGITRQAAQQRLALARRALRPRLERHWWPV